MPRYTGCPVTGGPTEQELILREKNESRGKNKIFLLKLLFSRKSSLKIDQVYLNLVNFGCYREE